MAGSGLSYDIRTDPSATFAAYQIFDLKVDGGSTIAEEDCDTYAAALWGNFIEDCLIDINEAFQGDAQVDAFDIAGTLDADGAVDFGSTLQVDGAASFGDFSAAAALYLDKAEASTATLGFRNTGAADDRILLVYDASENLDFERYVTNVLQDTATLSGSTGGWDFPGTVDITGALTCDAAITAATSLTVNGVSCDFGNGDSDILVTLRSSDDADAIHQYQEGTNFWRAGISNTDGAYWHGRYPGGVWSGFGLKGEIATGKYLFPDEVEIDGALNHDGSTVGFFGVAPAARAAAYTPSNVTPDRSYNADSTSTAELADVLGTLIADLQSYGLLQ